MIVVCASCGIAGIDEIKLKECSCDLVRYCSDECQRDHKSDHEEACKQRAAELREELLFKQPKSSHFNDCPICCLPLPLDIKKSSMYTCCSKFICKGCAHANRMRQVERRIQPACPFCREPIPTDEGRRRHLMKRVEANNPVALSHEGMLQYSNGNYRNAFEYFTKASELGDAEAHFRLASMYRLEHGVEEDIGKSMYHLEEAAIGGHPDARYALGDEEHVNGNIARAVKHWIIASTLGQDDSIKELMDYFRKGFVSNKELASALRAHKAAVDATKSPQREAVEECL